MTLACSAPDQLAGIAVRVAAYADCQARALGENGFQALIGGPIIAGLLSALVTIFVALIGYRFMLGETPSLRDGVGWTVRLGMVLTLTTAWPAFQILFYNVATNAPGELADVLLRSTSLPGSGIEDRVQQAYDTMRLGVATREDEATTRAPADQALITTSNGSQQAQGRSSPSGQLPQTASAFVLSTVGVGAALRIGIGFLLAVAPLALLTLLFDATLGIFGSWVRALAGACLALLASTLVTVIELMLVESELGYEQRYGQGMLSATFDQQALTTIVLIFTLAMLVAVVLAGRMAGPLAIGLRSGREIKDQSFANASQIMPAWQLSAVPQLVSPSFRSIDRPRAAAVADSLSMAAARDQIFVADRGNGIIGNPSRSPQIADSIGSGQRDGPRPSASTSRRLGRRTRQAARRDRLA